MNPILRGNARTAFRDPACVYHAGTYYLFYTLSIKENGYLYNHIALSESRDLQHFTPPRILTQTDRTKNYCSPGNILFYKGEFVLCFTSYPMPKPYLEQDCADASARLFTMRTKDFRTFSEPALLRVKGDGVPVEQMGRMIDPFIAADKDAPGKYWIFYKQNGVSMSYSYDLLHWTDCGHVEGGENACVLVEQDRYILIHSPQNGIGIKESEDLTHWNDLGTFYLKQDAWEWAQGRITAGFAMRAHAGLGYRYILFFHGSVRESVPETHGEASIGIAFSNNLRQFTYTL